jgi:hypothetical protein
LDVSQTKSDFYKGKALKPSVRQFLESKWLIFKSKWPWIKKIVFWYGIWDSPQICKFISSDNGLDHLGQWLASNNGLVPANRWVLHAVTKLNCNQASWLLSHMTCLPPVSAHLSDAKVNVIA